ncbi:MAG TPA: aminotransferase class IV [Flavisolibacter sp.]|jgi:branched-chain amino acid aminotransferase|nr:aminotransferase class IV [Flavisolibacter sp.]
MAFVCINGAFFKEEEPVLDLQNLSFKYGDGFFETMKICSGAIPLWAWHVKRMESSLKLLQFPFAGKDLPDPDLILELCRRNGCQALGRVRIAFFRTSKGWGFAVEAWSLDREINYLNQVGLSLAIYPMVRKSTDAFSNLKSANYLPYVMASLYAQEKGVDDCLVLNSFHHIADSSKANVFLVKNNVLITPALHQGCVNGVMRGYLIENCKSIGIAVRQQVVTEKDLMEADEVFLTNAVYGLRWVGTFADNRYTSQLSALLHENLIATIFR